MRLYKNRNQHLYWRSLLMKSYLLHITMMLSLFFQLKTEAQSPISKVLQINLKEQYIAGSVITLNFKLTNCQPEDIYLSTSYGNTVIAPSNIHNNNVSYQIPSFISNKAGWVYWRFTNTLQKTKGEFYILPHQQVKAIENYLGPPSLDVGNNDYAMLVSIPLDNFNNPVSKNTPITIHQSFLNTQSKNKILSNGMLGYDLIYTKTKSGRILMNTTCNNKNAKELTLEIRPNNPTDFKITLNTVHNFADGNQIVKFKTSVIKDQYDNIVANGTYINFKIQNNLNQVFQTYGTTINGVANAELIHPDYKQTWNIQAYVNGMAKSNIKSITFKEAVLNFEAKYNATKKTVTVGPFKSFMNQFIPDGLFVKLNIYQKNKLIKEINSQTENGYAIVHIDNYISPKTSYTIDVIAANITQQIKLND